MSVLTVEQVQDSMKTLLTRATEISLTDPVGAAKLLSEARKLMRTQSTVLQEKATVQRKEHESLIKETLADAFAQVKAYADGNHLPAFIASFKVGFQNEMAGVNGTYFDWAKRSERVKRVTAGRSRAGLLLKDGKMIGEYPSATAACKAQGFEIPINKETNKPSRNAILVLKDKGYTWQVKEAAVKAN